MSAAKKRVRKRPTLAKRVAKLEADAKLRHTVLCDTINGLGDLERKVRSLCLDPLQGQASQIKIEGVQHAVRHFTADFGGAIRRLSERIGKLEGNDG